MKNTVGYILALVIGGAIGWFFNGKTSQDKVKPALDITQFFLNDGVDVQYGLHEQRSGNIAALKKKLNEMPEAEKFVEPFVEFFEADKALSTKAQSTRKNHQALLVARGGGIVPPIPLPPPPPPCGSGAKCMPMFWKGDVILPMRGQYEVSVKEKGGKEIAKLSPMVEGQARTFEYLVDDFSGEAVMTITASGLEGGGFEASTIVDVVKGQQGM